MAVWLKSIFQSPDVPRQNRRNVSELTLRPAIAFAHKPPCNATVEHGDMITAAELNLLAVPWEYTGLVSYFCGHVSPTRYGIDEGPAGRMMNDKYASLMMTRVWQNWT